MDYNILVKAVLNAADLQSQLNNLSGTVKVNPIDQTGATASVDAIKTKVVDAATNGAKINPIDQINAQMALDAINARIAAIKADYGNIPVTSTVTGIQTNVLGQNTAIGDVGATLQYKNALGEVVTEGYKWDQTLGEITQTTARATEAQIQLTAQMNAYIAQADRAIASTMGKDQSDPTVIRLRENADTLRTTAQEYNTGIQNGVAITTEMQTSIKGMSNAVNDSSAAFRAVDNNVRSFGAMVENDIVKVGQWLIATTLIYGSMRQIGEAIKYVKDLNVELTNIEMITRQSATQVSILADQYNKLAESLGSTTLEVTKAAEIWLRQGKSLEDTNKLLKDSIELSKLGGISTEDSATRLTGIINGFKLSASEVSAVLDHLTVLANSSSTTASVSMGGLAEGLQRTANSANLVGLSLEKTLSYITTIATATQKDMGSVSSALDMVFARFSAVKAGMNLDAQGESLNNVEKSLHTLGIEIRDGTTGNFRSLGDVLDEVAGKWKNMGTIEQSEVAMSLAGNRNKESALSLLDNYSKSLEYQTALTKDAGTAADAYSRYQDNLEAATNRLTTSWEKLATDTANSSVVKTFIEFGASILKVVDAIGLFNLAIVALGTYLGVRFLVSIPLVTNVILNLAGAEGVATLATTTLASAITGGLIGIAIIGAIAGFTALNHSISDTYSEFEKLKTQTDSNQSELKDLADQYKILADKQDKNANDVAKLLDIQTTLNDKYGALKNGVNAYSDAIDGNSVAIQKNIDWIVAQGKVQAQNFLDLNKYKYKDALDFLITPQQKGMQQPGTNTLKPEEQVVWLDTYIAKNGDITGLMRQQRDTLEQQIQDAKNLINEYDLYQNKLVDTAAIAKDITPASKEILPFDAIQGSKDLEKMMGELNSTTDQVNALTESYKKYGQLSIDQVSMLEKTFGENYTRAISIQNGQIKLNTDELQKLTLIKAYDAVKTAEQLYLADQTNKSLKDQYNMLLEYYVQLEGGTALSTKSLDDQKKAQDDLLKDTENMLKQRVNDEKQSLQDSLTAYKDTIDKKKQALEDQATAEKQHLQDQMDGYKKIIDAEISLLDQKKKTNDYNDQVESKNKEISDIDAQLLALQFDNSEAAKAKRLQLENDRVNKTKDLTKIQNNYSIDNQKEALNKEYSQYEDSMKGRQKIIDANLKSEKAALDQDYKNFESNTKAKIAELDNYLKQSGTITSDAMKLIQGKTDAFYQSLLDWNKKYGTSMQQDVIDLINKATNGMMTLNSLLASTGNYYSGGNTGGGGNSSSIGQPGYNYYNPPAYGHHSGGIVGEGSIPKIKETEELSLLLKGENVTTVDQARTFMNKTLPTITNTNNNEGNISIGDLNVNVAGNVDKSILPNLKDQIYTAVSDAIKNRGGRRNAFSYSGG